MIIKKNLFRKPKIHFAKRIIPDKKHLSKKIIPDKKYDQNKTLFSVTESNDDLKKTILEIETEHIRIVKYIIDHPLEKYNEFKQRFAESGINSHFPELKSVIQFLICHMKLIMKNNNDPMLFKLATIKLIDLINIQYETKQVSYGYGVTMTAIKSALEFFDIYERTYQPENLGAYYHSFNYQYYFNNLLDINKITDCILLPTFYKNIGATDIIKLRPVGIYICGINVGKSYVDEFYQSPLEFFFHDINHSRRMSENMLKSFVNNNRSIVINQSLEFTNDLCEFMKINSNDSEDVKATKQLMRMLIFEIVHEDALYLLPEIVWDALHRDENYMYAFEKTYVKEDGSLDVKDYPIHVEGALAYTKYKLQHQFYDDGTKDWLVIPKYRYANYLTFSAMILLTFIKTKYLTCQAFPRQGLKPSTLVQSDEAFPRQGLKPSTLVQSDEAFPRQGLKPSTLVQPVKASLEREIKSYNYYLSRTSHNSFIPKPIHPYTIAGDDNNFDPTGLKTGLPQNYWKNGYRRMVGEHLNDTQSVALDESTKSEYDEEAHQIDLEKYLVIRNQFFK